MLRLFGEKHATGLLARERPVLPNGRNNWLSLSPQESKVSLHLPDLLLLDYFGVPSPHNEAIILVSLRGLSTLIEL